MPGKEHAPGSDKPPSHQILPMAAECPSPGQCSLSAWAFSCHVLAVWQHHSVTVPGTRKCFGCATCNADVRCPGPFMPVGDVKRQLNAAVLPLFYITPPHNALSCSSPFVQELTV
jgi:hypothetical protein